MSSSTNNTHPLKGQPSSSNSSTTSPRRGSQAQNVSPSWKWTRSNLAPSSLSCGWHPSTSTHSCTHYMQSYQLLPPLLCRRYRKPTDFKRKKLQLLTKKQLYLHLHQTIHKDSWAKAWNLEHPHPAKCGVVPHPAIIIMIITLMIAIFPVNLRQHLRGLTSDWQ